MSASRLFVVGATHHTAALAVREKLTLDEAGAATLAGRLRAIPGLREFALLHTCNRCEIYGVGAEAAVAAQVEAALCAHRDFAPEEFAAIALRREGPATLEHLMRVAAGVDSQLVGEVEIFGQVKSAYQAAQAAGTTGAVLNRSFQKVFQAAKQVRADTSIGEGQVSIANVAVELAGNIFGELAQAHVLLLGSGDVGEKTARAFRTRGARSVTVSSRHLERALELAQALGASAMPFTQRQERLAEFDVVVCATAAPTTIVDAAMARAALQRRQGRPQFFIDLAMPRDVAADVADLESAFLYNLDDLARIAETNRAARLGELTKCHAIVAQKSRALWQQLQSHLQQAASPAGPVPPLARSGPSPAA